MNSATYQIEAKPVGEFASTLEQHWDDEFQRRGWAYEYIGARINWADFVIADCFGFDELTPLAWRFFVEIKPTFEHVEAACLRVIDTEWQYGAIVVGDPLQDSVCLGRVCGRRAEWPTVKCFGVATGPGYADFWDATHVFRAAALFTPNRRARDVITAVMDARHASVVARLTKGMEG